MAITLSTAARNAAVDAISALVDAGAGTNGQMRIKTAGAVVLATIDLQATAFSAAVGGTATALGLPLQDPSAAAGGVAATFDIVDKDGTVVYSGTVSIAGGGGDAFIDDINISASDVVNLTALSLTVP